VRGDYPGRRTARNGKRLRLFEIVRSPRSASLERAAAEDWTVVSIKGDWAKVFA
jgi:hypothetical protein